MSEPTALGGVRQCFGAAMGCIAFGPSARLEKFQSQSLFGIIETS
jgi:hypothetical protein